MEGIRHFVIPKGANNLGACQDKCKGIQVHSDCDKGWVCEVRKIINHKGSF